MVPARAGSFARHFARTARPLAWINLRNHGRRQQGKRRFFVARPLAIVGREPRFGLTSGRHGRARGVPASAREAGRLCLRLVRRTLRSLGTGDGLPVPIAKEPARRCGPWCARGGGDGRRRSRQSREESRDPGRRRLGRGMEWVAHLGDGGPFGRRVNAGPSVEAGAAGPADEKTQGQYGPYPIHGDSLRPRHPPIALPSERSTRQADPSRPASHHPAPLTSAATGSTSLLFAIRPRRRGGSTRIFATTRRVDESSPSLKP